MRTHTYLSYRYAPVLASLGLACLSVESQAAEVASPSNLFPSPTGCYQNSSTDLVSYGATVQLALDHCNKADRSVPPPMGTTPVTMVCGETAHFRVMSGGSTTPVWVTAPVSLTLRMSPSATGVPGNYDLEVLAMNVGSGLPNGMMIRESPTLASTGHHTVRQVPSGTWYVNSFFDVFTELSLDGGTTWEPGSVPMHFDLKEAAPMVSATSDLPPACVIGNPLLTDISFPSLATVRGLELQNTMAITSLPMHGILIQASNSGRATGSISLDGGVSYMPFACDYTATYRLSKPTKGGGAEFHDGEIVSLSLSGGTLPGGVRIRESPTLASTGRTSVRKGPDGLYRISGFFDVFTELSASDGASWTPAAGPVLHAQFNPKELSVDRLMASPSSHQLPPMSRLKSYFQDGDIPKGQDLIEYPDGTIVRNFQVSMPSSSQKPPALGSPPQIQPFDCTVQCEVSFDGGVTYEPVRGQAAASMRVSAMPGGTFDTEMLALNLSAPLSSGSTLMLRESPTRASTGRTSLRSAPDGTKLIDSFFDVFTELSLDGGTTWSIGPVRWMAPESIRERILPAATYPPADSVLACGTDISTTNGVVLRNVRVHAIHNGSELPPTGGSKTFSFTTTASGDLSIDGGNSFCGWAGACSGTYELTDYLDDDDDGDGIDELRFFNGQLLSLELSGGGLGTVRLRESPTKASLGRTSLRTTPNNSFGTISFFDVFTELSLDGGATWTPASGLPATFAFTAPPREYFSPTTSVPLAGTMEISDEAIYNNGVRLRPTTGKKYRRVLLQQGRSALGTSPQDISFGVEMEWDVSLDGGATFTPVETIATCAGTITGGRTIEPTTFACEFTVGGTTLKIRESPTLPSRGALRIREASPDTGGGYMIESFFDIFTELSVDGGIVWSPQSNLMHLDWRPGIEQDNVFASDFFPPRDGSLDMPQGSPPIVFNSSTVISNMRVRLDALESRSQRAPRKKLPGRTNYTAISLEARVSNDGGVTWTPVSAPGTCTFNFARTNEDTDPEIDLGVSMEGLTADFGSFMIRESPTKASTGCTTIRYSEPNLEGRCQIDSFFDVFTELSFDGGTTWLPAENACQLNLNRVGLDVACSGTWSPEANASHRAKDPGYELQFEGTDVTLSGLTIGPATNIVPGGATPPPASGEFKQRTCTCTAGYYITSNSAARRWQLKFAYILWTNADATTSPAKREQTTEISGLNLCGDDEFPGMMLRESPTRASLGRTSIRSVPGGNAMDSFFDVFFELSLDGGQTWHAACSPLRMETVDASLRRIGIGGDTDPLPPFGFTAASLDLAPRSELGDKPAQAQFHSLIDSSLNMIDDRHMLGLKTYDTTILYSVGDTSIYNSARAPVAFGYSLTRIGDEDCDGCVVHDMEVTRFDMQGGTLPAGMKIRESPTLRSRGLCQWDTQSDGTTSVLSFFDVFTEISHDDGTTWDPVDLPLHFVQDDRTLSLLDTSEDFAPTGTYAQRGRPIRCPDGSCRNISLNFTSPRTPPPSAPGGTRIYPLQGNWSSELVLPGSTGVPVSSPVAAEIKLTHVDTNGATRTFDTEMLQLSLTSATLPGGFRLRESPTRQSLGKHSISDMGDGNFRICSFFDVFTEISLDGGQTWSESDGTTRIELTAPEIAVQIQDGPELADGASTIDFGVLLTGSTATRNILVSNTGNAMISDFGMSITGSGASDYSIPEPSSTVLPPGQKTSLAILLNGGGAGTRNATLHITSNDCDEGSFDIDLTARVLTPGGDDDGDGMTNGQELFLLNNPIFQGSDSSGVNPLYESSAQRTLLRDNGFYLGSDVQTLNMDVPLLQQIPGTNQFKLTFGLQKSSDLQHFNPFPMSAPQTTINAEGKLEFIFSAPDNAAFFRVQSP